MIVSFLATAGVEHRCGGFYALIKWGSSQKSRELVPSSFRCCRPRVAHLGRHLRIFFLELQSLLQGPRQLIVSIRQITCRLRTRAGARMASPTSAPGRLVGLSIEGPIVFSCGGVRCFFGESSSACDCASVVLSVRSAPFKPLEPWGHSDNRFPAIPRCWSPDDGIGGVQALMIRASSENISERFWRS